jgi:hypothetical protein
MPEIPYKVFLPKTEPTHIAVTGQIFGDTLASTGPMPGMHAYRARWAAEHSGAIVIAYERRSSTKFFIDLAAWHDVQPANYAATASETAALIDRVEDRLDPHRELPSLFVAASAGFFDGLQIARTEKARVNAIGGFDTPGVYDVSAIRGYYNWVGYQACAERRKPASQHNQHPFKAEPKDWWYARQAAAKGVLRAFSEIPLYTNAWRGTRALETLAYMATAPAYHRTTIRAVFPGKTFTAPPDNIAGMVNDLNALERPEGAASFQALYEPDHYHSWTDDPANYTKLVDATHQLYLYDQARPID